MTNIRSLLTTTLVCAGICSSFVASYAQYGLPLDSVQGSYPRIIRLDHSSAHPGAMLATFTVGPAYQPNGNSGQDQGNNVYRVEAGSTNWGYVTNVPTSIGSDAYSCCSALYEFPQQLGSFAAGTILLAARTDIGANAAISIWRSTDGGDTWAFHASLASAGSASGSVWEPEFQVDTYGNLVVHYSDERNQPNGGQVLAHEISTDGGLTWGSYTVDVGKPDGSRPGMPRVVQTPSGYVMAYEYCGTDNCRIHTRTSADGDNWGDPANNGPLVESYSGAHFQGSPSIAYYSWGGLGIIGRYLIDYSNDTGSSPGNAVMYTQDISGASGWVDNAAPFPTPAIYPTQADSICTNYSSTLLPSADGSSTYLVAAEQVSDSLCNVYVGPFN